MNLKKIALLTLSSIAVFSINVAHAATVTAGSDAGEVRSVSCPKFVYPIEAMRNSEAGFVDMSYTVKQGGTVANVSIEKGHELFNLKKHAKRSLLSCKSGNTVKADDRQRIRFVYDIAA